VRTCARRHGLLLSILLLIFASPCPAEEFRIGEFRALALVGEAALLPKAEYVSFTGDFGFSGALPPRDAVERHISRESVLLANFRLRVINLEGMLPGSSGRELDRRIDEVVLEILRKTGFDLVSRANNHAVDFGPEGMSYNTRRLQEAGYAMIGLRQFPVYQTLLGGTRIALFALTNSTDLPDRDGVILKIEDGDIALIKDSVAKADFRIAFIHLGSMSRYPSPHERSQVLRLLKAGADLVVCTGSHFTKGFVQENGKPVFYGIGDHLVSSSGHDTEPIGMHVVAGFSKGKLVQLFAIPFLNTVMKGESGPLSEAAFAAFEKTLLDRSTTDATRYFSDSHSLRMLKEKFRRFGVSGLLDMRPRHVMYAVGSLYAHYPAVVIVGSVTVAALVVLVGRWTVLLLRHRSTLA